MIIRCLHIADIFGVVGVDLVKEFLPGLVDRYEAEFVVVNGENAWEGKGISEAICKQLFGMGIHVITSGNHIWDKRKTFYSENTQIQNYLLRPFNYPPGNEGRGSVVYPLNGGIGIGVLNLQGRTFMYDIDCPFRNGEREIDRLRRETKIVIVDFHAEASAEKIAFAHYVDGKATIVIGTHTHVQTADERILPGGTGYITDVGMTGPHDGVIGIKKEQAIRRFIMQTNSKFESSEGDPKLHGLFFTVDSETGKTVHLERIRVDKK